jgi:hypothetical protein
MKSLPSSRVAALVSPWAVVPIVALALKGGSHLSQFELMAGGAFLGVVFAVPLTYLALLLVGYPAYKLLLHVGWLSGWTLCLFGCAAGAALGYAFVGIEAVGITTLCGFAVALVAWWILRKDLRGSDVKDGGGQMPNNSLERTREG